MEEILRPFIGTHVEIEQKNDVATTGVLTNVTTEYATVFTEDGSQVHIALDHIKFAITDHTELNKPVETQDPPLPENFLDLVKSLRKHMVKIEQKGHSHTGVLSESTDQVASIVLSNEKMIHYNAGLIPNIAIVSKKSESKSDSNSDSKNAKTTQTTDASGKGGRAQIQTPVAISNFKLKDSSLTIMRYRHDGPSYKNRKRRRDHKSLRRAN